MEGTEVALKLSGSAAKNIAAALYTIAKNADRNKTKGHQRLSAMLKSGKELKVFTISEEHLKRFAQEAKRYLHYGDIPQSTRAFANGKHLLILGGATEILGTECKVYLVVDASSIYPQLLQLSGRFALLALSIGLMGLAAVHWLISRTLRPLSELSEAADCIAAGNYSQRVPVVSQDEVGVLAKNFNRMALAVETHVDTLQEQNERQKLFIGAVTHELKAY